VSLSALSQPICNTLNTTYNDVEISDLIFAVMISCNFSQTGYMYQ
jgi:hypothetical protein